MFFVSEIYKNLTSKFVVSSKALNELFKILSESEDENNIIKINYNSTYAAFETNGYRILTRLLEGEFLNYKNAIPQESTTIIEVDSKELASRIERVSVMVTNRNSVILQIKDEKIHLNCESTLGNVSDVLPASVTGVDLEKIAFNFKYMLDALKHTQCSLIKIFFNGALSPIKIEPLEGNEFMFLVLPVRT